MLGSFSNNEVKFKSCEVIGDRWNIDRVKGGQYSLQWKAYKQTQLFQLRMVAIEVFP